MDANEEDDAKRHVKPGDLKTEPGSDELLQSAAMQPYLKFALAVMKNGDPGNTMAEIAALHLEERYVWRVASALKWAFADFDTINVDVDRETLSPDDRERLQDLLKHRPLQFCLFLKALLGKEKMQGMMIEAINVAKSLP
jgi:hypothetical protein